MGAVGRQMIVCRVMLNGAKQREHDESKFNAILDAVAPLQVDEPVLRKKAAKLRGDVYKWDREQERRLSQWERSTGKTIAERRPSYARASFLIAQPS